ncbi:MAG: hypothetical protein JWL73_2425 [Actinomycetia bacterium]|nr:hypothetical protein [Actinomycetes bacterium]
MTVARTIYEPPPRAWCLGRIRIARTGAADELVPWEVSQADIDDEAAALVPVLQRLGLHDTSHVDPEVTAAEDDVRPLLLIVSMLSETLHSYPFETAAGKLGALYSSADSSRFDSFRTAALIGYLHPQVVWGINTAVVEGLTQEFGRDLATVFGAVPGAVVTTDDGAFDALTAAGVQPWRSRAVGATTMIEDAAGSGRLRYDPDRWRVEVDADDSDPDGTGSLLLSNVAPRLTPSDRVPTGIRGHVPEPGTVVLSL